MAEPISPDESLRRLREFLRQLEQLLEWLATYDTFLIPGRHHEAFRAAWIDVRPRIGEVVKQLDRPAASNRADLKDLGLTGNQLAFKLGIFQHATRRVGRLPCAAATS